MDKDYSVNQPILITPAPPETHERLPKIKLKLTTSLALAHNSPPIISIALNMNISIPLLLHK